MWYAGCITGRDMKLAWLCCLLAGSLLIAGSPQTESNVNSRYIIESVSISGHPDDHISSGLRDDMQRLIGEKVDTESIENVAKRIQKELHVRAVTHKLLRGDTPEHVKVIFDVKGHRQDLDVEVPK